MYKYILAKIALTLLAITSMYAGYAQETTRSNYPKAVLVQLRSEHNRMAALIKARRYKDLERLKTDAIAIQTAMINDFQDHFTECPVYYYMDTNASFVEQKMFDGILLNANLTPAKNLPINSSSNDYLVAFYGYPVVQSKSAEVVTDTVTDSLLYKINERKKSINIVDMPSSPVPDEPFFIANMPNTSGPEVYMNNSAGPLGIGLVILNSKFLQVNYFYKIGYDDLFANKERVNPKYKYSSKHFEMEYYPFASLFSEKLTDRFGNHRVPIEYKTNKPE